MSETEMGGRGWLGAIRVLISRLHVGLGAFVLTASAGCQPMEVVHPSIVDEQLVLENCQNRRKCGVEWTPTRYSIYEDVRGTFGAQMWTFLPYVHDHPITYGEAPGDRVRSTQDGGALELEVGASYIVGDCVFQYLGSRVELLTPRTCGQPRKRGGPNNG